MEIDQAVYYYRGPEKHMVITVSVDNMAVTSKHRRDIEWFKAELKKYFEITDHHTIAKGLYRDHSRTIPYARR